MQIYFVHKRVSEPSQPLAVGSSRQDLLEFIRIFSRVTLRNWRDRNSICCIL